MSIPSSRHASGIFLPAHALHRPGCFGDETMCGGEVVITLMAALILSGANGVVVALRTRGCGSSRFACSGFSEHVGVLHTHSCLAVRCMCYSVLLGLGSGEGSLMRRHGRAVGRPIPVR